MRTAGVCTGIVTVTRSSSASLTHLHHFVHVGHDTDHRDRGSMVGDDVGSTPTGDEADAACAVAENGVVGELEVAQLLQVVEQFVDGRVA